MRHAVILALIAALTGCSYSDVYCPPTVAPPDLMWPPPPPPVRSNPVPDDMDYA